MAEEGNGRAGKETFAVGAGRLRITGRLFSCGEDRIAVFAGGTRPHIGAAALAEARASLSGDGSRSASASVLCRPGHKEDLWAREAALRLAAARGAAVLVSVGIHVDAADDAAIRQLRAGFEAVLRQMETAVANEGTRSKDSI